MEEVDVLPKGSLNRDVIAHVAAKRAIELKAEVTFDDFVATWPAYLRTHYHSELEEVTAKVQAEKEAKSAAKLTKKANGKKIPPVVIAEKGGEPMPPLDLYKGGAFPEHGLSKQELLLSMLSKNQEERKMMLEMLSQQNDD